MGSRIIKESICTSQSVDRLSWFAEVLFYRLIVNADDYGRFDGRIEVMRGRLIPLKRKLTDAQVEAGFKELVIEGMIRFYWVDGRRFIQIEAWGEHQQIRNKRSKFPDPPARDRDHLISTSTDGENSCNQVISSDDICALHPIQSNTNTIQSNTGICGETGADAPAKEKKQRRIFKAPTVEEVQQYCKLRGNTIDAEKFWAHYEGNGWRTGKGGIPMENWKAAVITWEKNEAEFKRQAAPARASTTKVNGATAYKQREYDVDALNAMFTGEGGAGG